MHAAERRLQQAGQPGMIVVESVPRLLARFTPEARTAKAFRCGDEHAAEHALIAQRLVAEQFGCDARLDHQVKRGALAVQYLGDVCAANPLDGLAVP